MSPERNPNRESPGKETSKETVDNVEQELNEDDVVDKSLRPLEKEEGVVIVKNENDNKDETIVVFP